MILYYIKSNQITSNQIKSNQIKSNQIKSNRNDVSNVWASIVESDPIVFPISIFQPQYQFLFLLVA
jgi:hypothetical protein